MRQRHEEMAQQTGGEQADFEKRQIEQRRLVAPLEIKQQRERRDRHHAGQQSRPAEAALRHLLQADDQCHHGSKQGHHTDGIDGIIALLGDGFRENLPRHSGRRQRHRQVHEKDPAPADGVDQESAHRRTGDVAQMKRHRHHAQSATAPFSGVKRRGDGPAVGQYQRAADAFDRAKADDQP